MKAAIIFCLALATTLNAADKKPKAMRSKGDVLFTDEFKSDKIDEKWQHAKGAEAAKFTIIDGALEMDQHSAKAAVIWRAFDAPVQDASMQLLMRPWACNWIAFGFYGNGERAVAERKLNIAVTKNGGVSVRDVENQDSLKAVNTKSAPEEWQRVLFESKGDKITISVNDREVLEYKTELTDGPKAGILLNLYGGKGSVDEIEVKVIK
ncbi:family 16 glycoside hydrolase [Prosthecobacter sp.]|jgi:hypothetical protein|uniref:family 16 glycoside hydrolase n=1 Tax=Prosthecobacter sp. TaxID=1965333 RepID=UPI00378498E1